jgi:predicted dehydrogenase
MPKTTRRTFLKTATIAGTGFFVAAGTRQALSQSPNEKINVACIGVGGKGSSDSDNAAQFGNVIAICDVDRNTLESKGNSDKFKSAERFTDFRELLDKHGQNIQIATISTPDHMHGPATLAAMRLGISCYTQKPLTRTIYEARLLAKVAQETGVCTQMGNQGTALNSSREAIAQIQSGVLGTLKEVYAWSNRPIWAQGPDRRMTLEKFAAQAKEEDAEEADEIVEAKKKEIARDLTRLDWKHWLGVAPTREYWPGLYHPFQFRGWWDFGSGALGDMACHQLTVPFASCGLRDPISVVAKTTGHDYDSFPASSIIKFEFPATSDRPAIPFWWYDRKGNKPPQEVFSKWGINEVSDSGVIVIGEKGAFYSSDDYCGVYQLKGVDKVKVDYEKAEDKGNNDLNNMYELFRARAAGNPKICHSNFIDRAGPLTETILLGNLAVWAAAKGGPNGEMGEWGEKVEWDARNLQVTNLAALKTPRVADLVKPKYAEGYRLD